MAAQLLILKKNLNSWAALELTLGRAPRSRDPPHKVLMKTYVFLILISSGLTHSCSLNEAPPAMDRESGLHKYSKAFEEMVSSCLAKDPAQRLVESPSKTSITKFSSDRLPSSFSRAPFSEVALGKGVWSPLFLVC